MHAAAPSSLSSDGGSWAAGGAGLTSGPLGAEQVSTRH